MLQCYKRQSNQLFFYLSFNQQKCQCFQCCSILHVFQNCSTLSYVLASQCSSMLLYPVFLHDHKCKTYFRCCLPLKLLYVSIFYPMFVFEHGNIFFNFALPSVFCMAIFFNVALPCAFISMFSIYTFVCHCFQSCSTL